MLCVVFMSSCVPRKNLIYLQGEPVSLNKIREINDAPYKLQVHDIISIDIKSEDEALVQMFKKEGSNQANNLQANNPGAGYFTGYSVDRHGNIRLPIINSVLNVPFILESVLQRHVPFSVQKVGQVQVRLEDRGPTRAGKRALEPRGAALAQG